MSQPVELSTFNLRYEGYRLRDQAREARLLASLALRGIEEPLQGVDTPAGRFLLNGFKRYWGSSPCRMSRWVRKKRRGS